MANSPQMCFRLHKTMVQRIRQLARRDGLTLTDVVIAALTMYLARRGV